MSSENLSSGLDLNKGKTFNFSSTNINDLGADSYTLVTIAVDTSGSTSCFIDKMEKLLKEIVRACSLDPRADNLMIRIVTFDSQVSELHGFKLLSSINQDDYQGSLRSGGMTALNDASVNSIEGINKYGRDLLEKEFGVNGFFICITDGQDNQSALPASRVASSLKESVSGENLESMLSILIELGNSTELDRFYNEVGFDQHVKIEDVTESSFAKLAGFISKSISSQSQHLGTGGPSKPLTF